MKRPFLTAVLLLAAAPAIFADYPSARTAPRMVYDPVTTNSILFGGETDTDAGTSKAYFLNETWAWTGSRWIQQYPSNVPPGRSEHVMVWDSTRGRVIMFGGRASATAELADTWEYRNGNWNAIATPSSPEARALAGAAYDPIRDRVVLVGGNRMAADRRSFEQFYDTWEFDGTTWTRVIQNGPQVQKAILGWDGTRNELIMLAVNDKVESLMFRYDPAAKSWNEVKPEKLPPCVNEAAMAFADSRGNLLVTGGVCNSLAGIVDETYEWDGTNWVKIEMTSAVERAYAQAMTYDRQRRNVVQFGGTVVFSGPRASTVVLRDNVWTLVSDATTPGPRSLAAVASDPVRRTTYLLGGLGDNDALSDFWRFENGAWQSIALTENAPTNCTGPTTSFDTARNVLVAVCADSITYEWDGTAWKKFAELKTKPQFRVFSSQVYDETLKKTVLFGGYVDGRYYDKTWLWDGAQWTELKDRRATARSLASMWYDPVLKKTVLYGGIGRPDPEDRLERYSDMWALDSNGWTQLKDVTTPGARYGSQVAVHPTRKTVILFGGLLYEPPGDEGTLASQRYVNDMWEWNGTTWKKLEVTAAPPARENHAMIFDPSRNQIVVYGGWAGYFLSDIWYFDDASNTWKVQVEATGRSRAVRSR